MKEDLKITSKRIFTIFIIKIIVKIKNKLIKIIIKTKNKYLYEKGLYSYKLEIKKRSKLNVGNYKKLALDIETLFTNELYIPNDFYGIANQLKKYINYPSNYQIKAAIDHGVYFTDHYWEADVNVKLPAIFCPGERHYYVLKNVTDKTIFKIGPSIAYASNYINSEKLQNEIERLGKNLLVFPLHSTHWVEINYNIVNFCNFINGIAKDFDSVRICLYWKDILRGHAEIYKSYGFECVTAGHIYDLNFLPRLRSIIESSTITMSNGLGTCISFCIYLKKPHYLIKENAYYVLVNKFDDGFNSVSGLYNNDKNKNLFYKLFGKLQDNISQQQFDLVDLYGGLSKVKTKEELKSLFNISEDLYKNFI